MLSLFTKSLLRKSFFFNIRHITESTNKSIDLVAKIIKQQVPLQQGLDTIKKLVEEQPKNLTCLGRYIGLLYQYKKYMELPEFMDKIKNTDPSSPLPLIFKALVNLDLNFHEEAKKMYELSQENHKRALLPIEMLYKSILLRRMRKQAEALKLIEKYLETEEGKNDYEALVEKIQMQIETNRHQDAINLVNKYLEKEPKNIQLRFYKAIALRGLNDVPNAIIEFTILIGETNDPKRKALLYIERARCRPFNELEERVADIKEAEKLAPDIGADKEILISYYMANRLDVCEQMIEKLEKKYNFEKDYGLLLIKGAVERYQHQDYKKAYEIYKKIREICPDHAKEHFDKQINVLKTKLPKDA